MAEQGSEVADPPFQVIVFMEDIKESSGPAESEFIADQIELAGTAQPESVPVHYQPDQCLSRRVGGLWGVDGWSGQSSLVGRPQLC